MKKPNPISVIFGVIQTALYADFAWVYWSRQRVKLRNGGVVDADDLSRGWLLRRIFGNKRFAQDHTAGDAEDDEEGAPALGGGRNNFNHHHGSNPRNGGNGSVRPKWGSRGISISADEGVLEHERERGEAHFGDDDSDDDQEHGVTDVVDPDAKMQDPDELARALDEEEEGGAQQAGTSSASAAQNKKQADVPSGLRGGDEWDDD